ncbi:MAG: chromosomal replication initiator protein DnaA [Candidatus Zixiibacteriota bacterium]|nr:MAG: chromosomal replication initiator protein DnaA [candidate division Zixibacteria bacterium]
MQERVTNSSQWNDCLNYLSRRVKEQSFKTWLKPTRGEPGSSGSFNVAVPNQFVADWIKAHFNDLIEEALNEVSGQRYSVAYVIHKPPDEDGQTSLQLSATGRPDISPVTGTIGNHQHNLNGKYNFESLVVGDFNQFACAAATAVAEAPGMTKYNPLYIYGGTGLGKTHIVQAIGHRILELFPTKRVMYATSEKFTSDFIASISNSSTANFTRVYRDVDVLIIDDIQFFTGKESTQEQFFHTFNTLYHLGKQIVLTSDRSPKEIKGLEERLLSRFSWGLVTDLQAPDLENRTAILYKKLETEGISVPENVIRLIADSVSTNIRELEGALIRLLAYASLKNEAVDLNLAEKLLSDAFSKRKTEVTIEAIQKKSSECFGIEPEMMRAKKKTSRIALARQVAMYLSRSLTDNSLKVIGDSFGGRDHSTVIHACDLISKKMSMDSSLRQKIDKISADLLY